MTTRAKKLFISYRSLDSAKVDMLVAQLRAIKDVNGTSFYDVWQDKTHIVSGQNWWDQIIEGIIGCDVFVFMMSKDAVQSPICMAEMSYARRRNRPIVPIVLEGEFQYNTQTGKNDLSYWELIPQELNDTQAQFLFYEGTGWVNKLETALAKFANAPQSWADILATKPQDPRNANDTTNHPATLYACACEAAEKLDINLAERLFLKLVNRDSHYQQYAREWIELLRIYDDLLRLDADKHLAFELPDEWMKYQQQFPKKFTALFDPKDFKSRYGSNVPDTVTIEITAQPVVARPKSVPVASLAIPSRKSSIDLLPAPFAWINIPAGKVKLEEGGYIAKGGQTFDVSAFAIGKYPISNAQYAKFVESGGYHEKRWWTEAGWKAREEGWYYNRGWKSSGKPWTEPLSWRQAQWDDAEQPVVGVSWYETVAFCLWMSEITTEKIMLPTEDQWQYAAQGDNGIIYPWGNEWDGKACNNSVKPFDSKTTTSVRQYESKSDSPFDVVDMAGNVWEWCLTNYDTKINDINEDAAQRVRRGGSWMNTFTEDFRCDTRGKYEPYNRVNSIGFRLALT